MFLGYDLVRRVDFSLSIYFVLLKSTLLLDAKIGTKNANLRAFLLPKSDISGFLTHPISDLNKSAKTRLLRAFTLTMTQNTSEQMY